MIWHCPGVCTASVCVGSGELDECCPNFWFCLFHVGELRLYLARRQIVELRTGVSWSQYIVYRPICLYVYQLNVFYKQDIYIQVGELFICWPSDHDGGQGCVKSTHCLTTQFRDWNCVVRSRFSWHHVFMVASREHRMSFWYGFFFNIRSILCAQIIVYKYADNIGCDGEQWFLSLGPWQNREQIIESVLNTC